MISNRDWDKVYRDSGPELLGVVNRYVRDRSKAEDVLHDAFILAINKEKSFSGNGSFEGWLYRIVVNTSLQFFRNNQFEK